MLLEIILFVLGFIFLIEGSDLFVKVSSKLAKKLGVSNFVIGLTIVAVGTSLPELISCIFASIKNQGNIIIGTIIGSNIANIGLVGGIIALMTAIKTKKQRVNKDGKILILIELLLIILIINQIISKTEGLLFMLLYLIYSVYTYKSKQKITEKKSTNQFTRYFLNLSYLNLIKKEFIKHKRKKIKKGIIIDIIILITSGLSILLGAKLIVDKTIFFANLFNISKNIIGLSIIAIGTSLPELSISISAVKKGVKELALGNIIGSCIANILLILGISSIINPLSIPKLTLYYTIPFMFIITTLFLLFIKKDLKIKKYKGFILLSLYIIFLISLFLQRI